MEQALTLHHIVIEWSLVDFTPRRDSSSISVYLSLFKEAFEHGAARVFLKAYSVRLHAILVNLPAVLGTTSAEFKLIFHQSAGVEFIINFVTMSVMIKWPKNFVNITSGLICHMIHYIVIVIKSEVVVYLFYITT